MSLQHINSSKKDSLL
uniref:Uncharacterized protein n=1 Tax=Rhizophora mucronata TaxID=61149 RepID=A0A2P2PNW4_RHIMU